MQHISYAFAEDYIYVYNQYHVTAPQIPPSKLSCSLLLLSLNVKVKYLQNCQRKDYRALKCTVQSSQITPARVHGGKEQTGESVQTLSCAHKDRARRQVTTSPLYRRQTALYKQLPPSRLELVRTTSKSAHVASVRAAQGIRTYIGRHDPRRALGKRPSRSLAFWQLRANEASGPPRQQPSRHSCRLSDEFSCPCADKSWRPAFLPAPKRPG